MSVDPVRVVHGMYVAHAASIHAYAARRVGGDLADDVLAETFRRAIQSYSRFDPALGTERGWLFGIAANVLMRHRRTEFRRLRALARAGGAGDSSVDPLLSVVGAVDAEREVERVLAAIGQLGHDDYDLLVLVAWEQMSSQDAAEVLGIPAGTVRSRLHRIREQLDSARSGEGSIR